MPDYQIKQDLYLCPTPAGSFYTVSSTQEDPARGVLDTLFQLSSSPRIQVELLSKIFDMDDDKELLALLHHMQTMGWLQGCSRQQQLPEGPLERLLPKMLATLSGDRKALLADQHGFYIAYFGFEHDVAENLSALSADLSSMQEKYALMLQSDLTVDANAWSIPDAFGNSQIGFWALYIGGQRFVLVIQGMPKFNMPALTDFIWLLSHRYGKR